MTMVTHKTLLQPLRLHYIIESNAGREGGGEEEERREGKRKYRIEKGTNWKTEKGTWSLRAPDDVVGSHNQFVHQHTEGVWPWVLDKSPSMLVRGRQWKENHFYMYLCMYIQLPRTSAIFLSMSSLERPLGPLMTQNSLPSNILETCV